MYAFPTVILPPKAVAAAEEAKQPPDVFYAYRLLEETGKNLFRILNYILIQTLTCVNHPFFYVTRLCRSHIPRRVFKISVNIKPTLFRSIKLSPMIIGLYLPYFS